MHSCIGVGVVARRRRYLITVFCILVHDWNSCAFTLACISALYMFRTCVGHDAPFCSGACGYLVLILWDLEAREGSKIVCRCWRVSRLLLRLVIVIVAVIGLLWECRGFNGFSFVRRISARFFDAHWRCQRLSCRGLAVVAIGPCQRPSAYECIFSGLCCSC